MNEFKKEEEINIDDSQLRKGKNIETEDDLRLNLIDNITDEVTKKQKFALQV